MDNIFPGRDHPAARLLLAENCMRAIDAAPVGIVVVDARPPETPLIFANLECTAITGYEEADLVGRPLHVLHGTDSEGEAVATLQHAIAAGQPATAELRSRRKNGEPFWMRMVIRPIRNQSGDLIAFIGVLTDITASHLVEARLRALTEAIPLPMLTMRQDGTVHRANTAAEECLGVAPGSLPGRRIEDFAPEEEIPEESFCHRIRRHDSIAPVEVPARRPDGRPLWLLASSRQFEVEGDRRIVLVFQDVTELKLREQRLTEANEEAERNIRARMRFLAAASHDLRQPLQAMALFTSALDHHVATPQGQTIVQSLKTSLRGMEEMFDALLDMSKLDAGVMKSEPRLFLINDIFDQLEATYGPQAEAAGLKLTVVPSSAAVKSDPRLLARIVGNFLSNAIRYTRSGRILLGARHYGSRLRVSVSDTGPGIPESQRLDIFREFRQGGAPNLAGRNAGMGLGLAIVQRLARLLGHPLDVRSTVGHGSTFAVDVPLAEEFLPAPTPEDDDTEAPDVVGATVVVIDDDPDIQDALTLLLTEWGCFPVVAASAEEAQAQLDADSRRPDVILADLHLRQHHSGVDAIAALRERAGTRVPAFLFTGDTSAAGEVSMPGDLRILRKPLDPARLRMLVALALGGGLPDGA